MQLIKEAKVFSRCVAIWKDNLKRFYKYIRNEQNISNGIVLVLGQNGCIFSHNAAEEVFLLSVQKLP